MKRKLLITGLLCLTLAAISIAQPELVQKAFEQKFPKATKVNWSNENATVWLADFQIDKVKYSAVYTPQGTWKETIKIIKLGELPTDVRNSIITKFPDWEITEINKTEKAKSGVAYEVNLKKGREKKNIAFGEDGAIIR